MAQWRPGQSGNPSGVSKESQDLKGRLRKLTPKALQILEAVLDSTGIELKDKIHTARFVIERTIPAAVEADFEQTPAQTDQAAKVATILRKNPDRAEPEELAEFESAVRARPDAN